MRGMLLRHANLGPAPRQSPSPRGHTFPGSLAIPHGGKGAASTPPMTGPAASRGARPTAARQQFRTRPGSGRLRAAVPAFRGWSGSRARRWPRRAAPRRRRRCFGPHVRERRRTLVLLDTRIFCARMRAWAKWQTNVLPTVARSTRRSSQKPVFTFQKKKKPVFNSGRKKIRSHR